MKKKSKFIFLNLIGSFLILLGIYLSIFKKEPHFYTPFSIGLLIVLITIYNKISKRKIFEKWNIKRYLFFFLTILILCIVIDKIGLAEGAWKYQYDSILDEILKYLFEWAVPLIAYMTGMMIGIKFFEKKLNYKLALIISLIFFVIPLGIFTEYINLFSDSWIIIRMPISSMKIKGLSIIFQLIGYPLMAIISFIVYKISEKIK